jgi:hypothetical protein
MVRNRGLQSLWRGLGPTLWRDVPFSGEQDGGHCSGLTIVNTALLARCSSVLGWI